MDSILSQLLTGANQYANSLTVSLKTNVSDAEIPLYQNRQGENKTGLLSALGIDYALIVRDANGHIVTTYNEPPPTDPLRQAALWALLAGVGFVVLRGVWP